LLALGFINLAIWPGDILRVYGVSLLLAARLITASNRRLLLGAFGYVVGFVVLFLVLDFGKNWDWTTLTYQRLWTTEESGLTALTLSQIATFVLDSLSVSCSGVNLSSSHHGKSGGHDMPSRS